MAVKRSQNWLNQQRVDVPHLRSIESAVRNDFDELIGSFAIGMNASYVIRGFELNMVGAIGASASALQMIVENSALFHGKSAAAGTFYQIPTGAVNQTINSTTNPIVQGSFTPSALNYVGIELSRTVDPTTTAQVFLWNPTNKNEISKTVPLAETLGYKIVVTSSIWAANVLPISIVETDSSNNVLSVEDRRPMLFRLGTGGPSTPNPFNEYGWNNHIEGRTENFWKSTSSVSPFRGGDKQILHFKEWADAVMSSLLEIKGSAYWYSPNSGGSINKLRGDLALLQLTGAGKFSHDQATSGKINWSSDIFLKYIGSRLDYKITSNPSSANLTLADNEVAYLNIVRGVDIIPNLIFTQTSAIVTSVGAVAWTSDVVAGDYIKVGAEDDTKYYKILSVDSASQVTLTEPFLETSTGSGGVQAKYAYGTYTVVAVPSTNRHVQKAIRRSVPFNEDIYWLFFRDDNGSSIPRIYIRGGTELEKGEEKDIQDDTSDDILAFIGSTGETDNSPNYTSENFITDGDNLVVAISKLDNALKANGAIKIVGGGTLAAAYSGGSPNLLSSPNWTPAGSGPISITNAAHRYAREIGNSLGNFNLAQVDVRARTVGAPTGNILMKIYSDLGGLPNTVIATSNPISIASLTGSYTTQTFVFATPPALANGTTYHYAVEYSGATIDGSNYVQWDSETIAPPNSFDATYNGSVWSEAGGGNLISMQIYEVGVGAGVDLSFDSDFYLEIKGLNYADNTLPTSESPINFPNDQDVAYVSPNLATGGPALTVTVDTLDNVPANAIIVARREGNDVIVGTSSTRLKNGQSSELYAQMSDQNRAFIGANDTSDYAPAYSSNIRGTASESLTARAGELTDAMGDAQEDRSAYLRSDNPVTWTGTQLQFTTDIVLEIINTKSGALKSATIQVADSPIALANNESAWVLIDRTVASENLTVNLSGTTPIPAQTQANKDVIIIARRKDALGAGYLHLPLHKQVLEPGQTVRLGASGAGSGSANEILETLKNHFVDATFDLLTPNIFESDADDKVDGSSTGAYSLVTKTFDFSAGGQTLVSTQMADEVESLANTNALSEIELMAFWDKDFIDTAAVYAVSRNGGNEWQTVTMERVGTTELYRGIHKFTDEATNQNLFSQLVSDTTRALNATSDQELSQRFVIPTGTKMLVKDVILALTKTGSPTGNLYVGVYTDTAGDPTDVIVESNAIAISGLVTGNNTINLPDVYLTAGTYHLKLRTDATYKGVFSAGVTQIAVQSQAVGVVPYLRTYNGTVWANASTENLTYTLRGITIDLRVRITSSAGSKKLDAYGIFYDKSVGNISTGVMQREVFHFNGSSNQNEFTITKFVPNADLLKVYDVNSGQVYTHGVWSLQGQKVVFEVNQFNVPNEAITLIFDQTTGGAFDNSDLNGLLLANNHLGSTDGGIDKSVNGRGIFLRRPDGTLREIAIDDNDNIVIFSV